MSSSDQHRSRILRGSDVDARPWDLPDMGGKRSKHSETVEVKPPTAAEIEAIQLAAQREGYQAGYETGQADGYQQGLKDGKQAVDQAAASLQAVVESMAKPLAELDEEIEQDLLELVKTIAEQVLQRELDARPAALRRIIRDGLKSMPASERRGQIAVNPEDHDWLLDDHALSVDGWHLVADHDVSRGGCRIESCNSTLDATLETRIAEAMERLFDHDEQGHPLHSDGSTASDTPQPDDNPQPTDKAEGGSNEPG